MHCIKAFLFSKLFQLTPSEKPKSQIVLLDTIDGCIFEAIL